MDRTSGDPTFQPAPDVAAPGVAETAATFESAHPVLRTRAPAGHEPDLEAILDGIERRFPKTLARLAE